MKGPEELNAQLYGHQNEISKNRPAPYEADSSSSFDREFCSYSAFENHSCSSLRYSYFSPTPSHLTELKTKKLEVALQRIQEQLQLNLLKQALIIKQQKFDKLTAPSKNRRDQWNAHYFETADGDLQGVFSKESQSRIIKRECDIFDEGHCDSSNSENDCKLLGVIDRHHHSNFSSIKKVVQKVNATDEEKNFSNDLLTLTADPPFNVDELDLNKFSSMCCQNSVERNSYLGTRRSFSYPHVRNPNSANHIISDDNKFSTMQLQQQLGIQQQELIQQLQLVQRQYLMHQEMLTQEAQHSPALIFPSYGRTPLQPFEYRSKDNHGFSSTLHLKGNGGNLVPSQDLSKQDQTDQQPDNVEVTRNDLEPQEAEAETYFADTPQTRKKYKNHPLPFSPSSKEPLNGANADNSKVESHLMHSEYSKAEQLKEPLNSNIRDPYSNEQSEDEGHSENPVCSPVDCLTKTNSPTAEGENHNYQPLHEKCDKANRNEMEISPRPCNVINDSLNDTMSNDQQSSFSLSFDEFFNPEKHYHHLFAHGMCRWPGCDLILDDVSAFMNHLNTEHRLDDRSMAQARVQMQVVSQLEIHLQKERNRLQSMMNHLYFNKQFAAERNCEDICSPNGYTSKTSELNSPSRERSSPFMFCPPNLSISNHSIPISIRSPVLSSSNIPANRKRISDKTSLSLSGGLPYMLERAGLDVQQEITRNREFYKNADVRPPFTYASLIRQSIIESPDKQLTLNEIYNWFQNTFCYFRRNAATWKNAIRTNLSLHKCFIRYEDDFGSFWMVDDNEFVKRRHLSRGRPRKYEPSTSPISPLHTSENGITNNGNDTAYENTSTNFNTGLITGSKVLCGTGCKTVGSSTPYISYDYQLQ